MPPRRHGRVRGHPGHAGLPPEPFRSAPWRRDNPRSGRLAWNGDDGAPVRGRGRLEKCSVRESVGRASSASPVAGEALSVRDRPLQHVPERVELSSGQTGHERDVAKDLQKLLAALYAVGGEDQFLGAAIGGVWV